MRAEVFGKSKYSEGPNPTVAVRLWNYENWRLEINHDSRIKYLSIQSDRTWHFWLRLTAENMKIRTAPRPAMNLDSNRKSAPIEFIWKSDLAGLHFKYFMTGWLSPLTVKLFLKSAFEVVCKQVANSPTTSYMAATPQNFVKNKKRPTSLNLLKVGWSLGENL